MKNITLLVCFIVGTLFGYIVNSLVTNTPAAKVPAEYATAHIGKMLIKKQSNDFAPPPKKEIVNTHFSQTNNTSNPPNKLIELSSEIEEFNIKYQSLQDKYEKTKNRLMEITLEVESLDESDITDEQMMALINDDFSEFRRGYRGVQRDKIFDFHQQEDDLDWGFDMQTKISDFIITHYSANGVRLSAITCKEISCELLIEESENNAWEQIFDEMKEQAWWRFRSTNSSSRSSENETHLMYLFMSK